jgi:hypothetical protein
MGARHDECRCHDSTILWGASGDDYVMHHLVRDQVGEGGGEVLYRCPATRRKWVGEFTVDDEDIPAFRLRRVMTAAELVDWLAGREDDLAMRFAYLHPDVEFRPVDSRKTYHGADRARDYATRAAADPDHAQARALSLIDVDPDRCVVLGSVAYKRDGVYSEHRPAAWLVTMRNGKVICSLWFDSWMAARKAAGLSEEGGPGPRRLGDWVFPVLRRPAGA